MKSKKNIERIIYDMEFKFVRYFLFMGLNPKTYNFDKKVSNIYVLLKSIEVYETYLSTAEIDENYEKNFESEYEKMAKEKDVRKINFNEGPKYYKAILKS